MGLVIDIDRYHAKWSGGNRGKDEGRSHEDGLTETVWDLKQGGVQSIEPETSSHECTKVGSPTVGDVGGESEEKEEVGSDIEYRLFDLVGVSPGKLWTTS
jgi:hypothetical protein